MIPFQQFGNGRSDNLTTTFGMTKAKQNVLFVIRSDVVILSILFLRISTDYLNSGKKGAANFVEQANYQRNC